MIESDATRSKKATTATKISHTRTFELRFEQILDNDESALVEMEDFVRTPSRARSSNVSEASLQ